MNSIKLKTRLSIILLILFIAPLSAIAGAPAGAIGSLDPDIAYALRQSLDIRGYCDACNRGRVELELALYRYLWDNRAQFTSSKVSSRRTADLAICLMVRQGDGHLENFIRNLNYQRWCEDHLKKTD